MNQSKDKKERLLKTRKKIIMFCQKNYTTIHLELWWWCTAVK